jgi:hypothetical protein
VQAKRWGIGLITACCVTLTGAAYAQPDDKRPDDKGAAEEASDGDGTDDAGTDDAKDDDAKDDDAKDDAKNDDAKDDAKTSEEDDDEFTDDSGTDPKELDSERYYFLGIRFRNFVVPAFLLNTFVDGGTTVNSASFGPEFTTRKDGLELNLAISYQDFSMEPTLMKSKDDDNQAYELVESDLKGIAVTIDILFEVWKSERSQFAFLIGGGVGLSGIFDELRRNQVYPKTGNVIDPDNPEGVAECSAAGDPNDPGQGTGAAFCDGSNDHYGDYKEPSWANGGSKPFIFPYINLPQVSFRYKPIKQLQMRADLGFAITNGFFFGGQAAYGF